MASNAHNAFDKQTGNPPSGLVYDDKDLLKGQHRDAPISTADRMGTNNSKTRELGKISGNNMPKDSTFLGLGKGGSHPGDATKLQ